ncbi:MAG: hypothetical protein FWF56_04905 [Firmicutes bacterium]|nr:hypothetical protein [Bacillota bacterium]
MELVTASNLWKGLNLGQDDLDVSILSNNVENGVESIDAYFTVTTLQLYIIRVRCSLHKRVQDNCPDTVMLINDIGVDYNKAKIAKYLDEGFAVFCFDYLGERETLDNFTIYPLSLSFCNYYLNKDEMNKPVSFPQDSCWYFWSLVAFKAVAMIEYLSSYKEKFLSNSVAIVGIGAGGACGIKVATVFDSIKSIVVKYDADSYVDSQKQENIVNNVSFSSGSYTPFIDIPLLLEVCSNESDDSFDNMIDIYETVGVDIVQKSIIYKRLSISESRSHSVGPMQSKNEILWLKQTMLDKNYHDTIPLSPTIGKKISQNVGYFNLAIDEVTSGVDSVQVFITHDQLNNQSPPAFRYWYKTKAEYLGDGEYIVKIDSLNGYIYRAFANVHYTNGFCLSTMVEQIVFPSNKGEKSAIQTERLVYDSEMGIDSWMTTNRELDEENGVILTNGPFDIQGVSGLGGELSNFKLGALKYRGQQGYVLQVTMYSSVAQQVLFGITTQDGNWYNHVVDIDVQKAWSKFNLIESDFKGNGKLDWGSAVCIRINSEQPVVVSGVLWL